MGKILHKHGELARVCQIEIGDKVFNTPTYFPSLSSTKNRFSLVELFYFLKNTGYPRLLVSAYDIEKIGETEEFKQSIAEFRKFGILFMDSGLFESDNKGDSKWNLDSYKSIISQVSTDIFTGFDLLPYPERFTGFDDYRNQVIQAANESSLFWRGNIFLPIIHGKSTDELLALVKIFMHEKFKLCTGLAVSERDCGKSIFDRAKTLTGIRRILNSIDENLLLHVLGCGNPVSMLIYSYCGADSFDSLDWIEHVLDPGDNSIRDFSQLDLIDCKCKVCSDSDQKKLGYLQRTLLHNLQYYQDFVILMQNLIEYCNLSSFINTLTGHKTIEIINSH